MSGKIDVENIVSGSGGAPSSSRPAAERRSSVRVEPVCEPVRGPVVEPAIPEENLGLLESSYDVDRLYAVPRDPERIFATWDISGATRSRARNRQTAIRFTFEDGFNTSTFTDVVPSGNSAYYCAVPAGRLWFTVEMGFLEGSSFEPFMSTEPMATAIGFVRPGTAEFVRVDLSAPIGRGVPPGAMVPVAHLPFPVNVLQMQPSWSQEDCRRWLGYMPVSGRK